MKKILLFAVIITLNLSLFSCTPEQIIDDTKDVQACCANEGTIEVPPPPPPPKDVDGN